MFFYEDENDFILWKVENYTYGFANSGTGYKYAWHLNGTYWAYKY